MSDDYWQTTAQMFGSIFEKPKMTEKLLLKPPFKYLFDIVMQTINSTGFAKNLYNQDELSADFYDTKEKKMYFLNKIILLTGNMLKEEIEAKPNKIVAGVEPDKTNFFLQALYRAAVSGEDSSPYVKKLLAKLAKEEAGGGEEAKQEEAEKPKEKKAAPKEEPKVEKEKPKEKPKEEKPSKPKAEEKPKEPERPPATEKLQRPGTASKRPPPEKSNVQVVDDKRGAGTSNIIRDDQKRDEDENLFESQPQEKGKINRVDAAGHGQFVKEALKDVPQQDEAEKEEPAQGGSKIKMRKIGDKSKPKAQAAGGLDAKTGSSATTTDTTAAGTSQGEVEVIQKLIQSLTQNINPLRKSVDFINDDIESMNKEMENWRSQYLNSKAKHQLELMGTEEQLQPLQNKLAELEEQIKDKKFKIQAAKSSILQNEQKIQKLLYSVVSNK